MDKEVVLIDIAMLEPQIMQSRQCQRTRRKILHPRMSRAENSLHDEPNDPPFFTNVAEKPGTNLSPLEPLIRSCFPVKLRNLPGKSCEFRYYRRLESGRRGFVDIAAKLLTDAKLQIVDPQRMPWNEIQLSILVMLSITDIAILVNVPA